MGWRCSAHCWNTPTTLFRGADHRGLVRATPITVAEVETAVTRPDAGAVVVFAGRVRDHDHGRSVAALTYEAHPDADKVMADVLADASEQPGVLAAASLHRTGISRSAIWHS